MGMYDGLQEVPSLTAPPPPLPTGMYDGLQVIGTEGEPRPAEGFVEHVQAGWQGSAIGLAWRGKLPDLVMDPNSAVWWERLTTGVTGVGFDLPVMIPAGAKGAALGAAAGPVGSILAGGAAMFAAPAGIRTSLTEFYKARGGETPIDWFNVVRETAKSMLHEGAIGAATFGAGAVARGGAAALMGASGQAATAVGLGTATMATKGASKIAGTADLAAQIAAMVTVPHAIAGTMPERREFLDAAAVILTLKGAHVALENAGALKTTAQRVMGVYEKTGKTPAEQVADAMAKPDVAADLTADAPIPTFRDQLTKQEELWSIQDRLADLDRRAGAPEGEKPLTAPEAAERDILRTKATALEAEGVTPEAPRGPVQPAVDRFAPDQLAEATERARTRLQELTTKAGAEALTDAERAERIGLVNAMGNPEALAKRFGIEPAIKVPTAEERDASTQRVYDDVLRQLREADQTRQAAGTDPLGDPHAMAVASIVSRETRTYGEMMGRMPEDIYRERYLTIRDQDAAGAAREAEPAPAMPPEAPRAAQPEVDLFGNPIEPEVPPQLAVSDMATVEVPLANLRLSKEVPQFKKDANAAGVIVPLGGKFDRTGVGPIQVWERLDGSMEVISGRHRLDLARRSGEETIPAQIHREAEGFSARQAATLDAQLNIREEQGSVADYAQYFKDSAITEPTANELGLLARAKGRSGFAIARDASPDTMAAHRAGLLTDEAALVISQTAPGSERLQALGIAMVNDGKSALMAANTMKAVDLMAAERQAAGQQGDIFGFDDSAMREAAAMAKKASSAQRKISEQISAVSGASKRPELARKMGVDVQDPEGIQKKIAELKQEQYQWDNWPLYPELVAKLRASDTLKQDVLYQNEVARRTVTDLKEKHPNVVVRDVRDRDGNKLGDIFEKYDGTEEGARAAAQRIDQRLQDEYPDYSNVASRIGATDENGNPKWAISPNLAHVNRIGTREAAYTWGDMNAAPDPTKEAIAKLARYIDSSKIGIAQAEAKQRSGLSVKDTDDRFRDWDDYLTNARRALEYNIENLKEMQAKRLQQPSAPAIEFELKPETPAELKARDEEAVAAAKRKLAQERAGVKGPVPTVDQADLFNTQRTLFQQANNGVPINADALSKEVLSKIDRALKAMGYDSRGTDDVRTMLKTRIAPDGVLSHPDWLKAYERATGSVEKRKATQAEKALEKEKATHVNFERIRELGTTSDIREAGYITPTGSFIDLSGKREGGPPGARAYDHREAGGTDGMQEFMALGNIRMDFNAGTMDISKEPTPEQYRKITTMAQAKNGELVIDLERGLGEFRNGYYGKTSGAFSREYPAGTKPARIMADIQRYYAGEEPLPLRPLYQEPGQERDGQHLGSYEVADRILTMFEHANKSTVIHEVGHHFLENLKYFAMQPNAPPRIRAMWETARKEFAIGEDGDISTASHEMNARSFERYLGEGQAPSIGLRAVFDQFKTWMLEIYKNLQNIGVQINPEVRSLFDRMLATDQEIADARELGVPRAYIPEARREAAERIVPPAPEGRKIEPGFEAEKASMEPYADELPPGPGKAPDASHVNYAYMNGAMDVKLAMQRMAEIDQANIQKQRGGKAGVESWAEEQAKMESHLLETLGGGPDKLGVLRGGLDPNDPKINHRLRAMNQLMEGAARDSARLRDVVLTAGHDATVRQQLEYMGSIERARMLQAEFLGERAAVARAMNALKDVTEGSGEIAKMLDVIGYGEAAARELFQTARTPAEEQAYMRAKLDEILQNYRGKTVLDIAKLHKEIGTLKGTFKFSKEVTKATKWEMVVEGWKASLLSGPVTHTTNLFGTEGFHFLRPAVDALAATIGMARGASPGMGESDRASMSEAVARLGGMISGIQDGVKVGIATFKLDDPTGKTEAYRTAIPGRAGELIRIPLRLMGAEDAMVTTMYKRGELATLAIRQAFDEQMNPSTREFAERVAYLKEHPTPEMEAAAESAATRMTFNSPLGEKGVALQLFVNKWNLQWMIPFIRTPINITKEVARMSPLAPMVGEWRAAIAKGGVERDRAIAETALGAGIMALAMAMTFDETLSGAGSPDPGKNRGKVGVWQPYSRKIGDTWYEYARIQPVGTLVGMAADVATIWDHMNDEEKDKIPKLMAVAFSNAVTNQTFLQGITNVINAMSEPTRFLPRFANQMAGSMIPNVIGQPTAMADPYVREVNGMIEAIQARIPGMREMLIPKRDWLGEEVESKERVGAVLPVRKQKVSEDKVRLEAARLDISMATAPRKTHIGKGTGKLGDVPLTPEERNTFAKVGGEMAHQVLTNVVNQPGYDAIPDLVKRKMFARVLTASHQIAAVAALPPDKRVAYITSISEKMATALEPEAQ